MELTAVCELLKAVPHGSDVLVTTDSKLIIGWVSDGWKRKDLECASILREIDLLIERRSLKVSFNWVRGHSGDPMNELADNLAVEARSKDRKEVN